MKVLLLGCGFVGKVLARRLQQEGNQVVACVRGQDSANELKLVGIDSVVGDFTEDGLWEKLSKDFQLAIHIASSGRGDASAYERVYLGGMQRLQAYLPTSRKIFISSTSVYGQVDGEWVDEVAPALPSSSTSQVLLKAEEIALNSGGCVVRPSGIYGPHRSVLFQKFMEQTAVIEGDGKRWVNQIHRDDVASGIYFLATRPELSGIFNLTDNYPTNAQEIYRWLSEKTGKPLPPPAPENHQRKRGWTHKRISNQKMKNLGWTPLYPSFIEGYSSFAGF